MRKSRKISDRHLTDQELHRYVMLLMIPSVLLLLVLVAVISGQIRRRTEQASDTQSATKTAVNQQIPVIEPDTKEYFPNYGGSILSKDAVPEVKALMEQYFQSISDCDMALFQSLFTSQDTSKEEYYRKEFEQQRAYVDGYQNISCYTAMGPEADTYGVYVYYELRYQEVETAAPGLVRILAVKGEDGVYRIYDGELTDEYAAYLDQLSVNEDVRLLTAQVDRAASEACEADEALRERMDYMKNGSGYQGSDASSEETENETEKEALE